MTAKHAMLMRLAVAGAVILLGSSHVQAECEWGLTGCNEGGDTGVIERVRPILQNVQPNYKTNKFRLKAEEESGGWILAWSDDISETDALQGVVAAGVSIYSGGGSFALWINNLVQRTMRSTMRSVSARFPDYIQNQATSVAKQVIFDALQSKSPRRALRNYDTVDFKAGAIRYSGGNYLGDQLVGPRTWGMKVYLGFRVR